MLILGCMCLRKFRGRRGLETSVITDDDSAGFGMNSLKLPPCFFTSTIYFELPFYFVLFELPFLLDEALTPTNSKYPPRIYILPPPHPLPHSQAEISHSIKRAPEINVTLIQGDTRRVCPPHTVHLTSIDLTDISNSIQGVSFYPAGTMRHPVVRIFPGGPVSMKASFLLKKLEGGFIISRGSTLPTRTFFSLSLVRRERGAILSLIFEESDISSLANTL